MEAEQRERDRSRRGDRPSRFSDLKARDRSGDRNNKSDCKQIYVSNIPYEYRWTELKDLFKEQVGDVSYVELFKDEDGKSRGCGIVVFNTATATQRALEVMHRHELQGRRLVLKEDHGNIRDKCGFIIRDGTRMLNRDDNRNEDMRTPGRNSMGGAGGMANMPPPYAGEDRFNTYGLSMQFLDSIGIQMPLICRVFVANLDYKVDRKKLKEVFKMAGRVLNIDLGYDKEGKSRGFGVIEYEHPVEAVQAISMFDKQMLFDRRMTVRMDRVENKQELRLPEGLKSIGLGLGPSGEPMRNIVQCLPQAQQAPAPSGAGLGDHANALGAGILGGLGGGGVFNGLGAGLAGAGLGAGLAGTAGLGAAGLGAAGLGAAGLGNAGLGAAGLNLQALTGLTALQNQLLQQQQAANLAGADLSGALAGAPNIGPSADHGPANLNSSHNNSIQGSGYGRDGMMQRNSQFGRKEENNARNKTSDMVIIQNLPPTVTWQFLRDKFSEIGEVKFAEITGNDTGVVRFSREWDAERAIKMFDRTRIDGRTIELRYF